MKTNAAKLRGVIARIVAEAFDDPPHTMRSPTSERGDDIVQNAAAGMLEALVHVLEDDEFASAAYELVAGVPRGAEHDVMAPGRLEDVEDLAAQVAKKVLSDPMLHDQLRSVTESLLRGLM